MAKITRVLQKIFGSTAGFHQIGKFGSLAAGGAQYTTDAAGVQELSNYLDGWYSAVIGGNSPAIQDMNALCFLYARQLAYLFQSGVPEWEAGTTYYKGSIATNSLGLAYVSITDDNTGNVLTDLANWRRESVAPTVQSFLTGSGTYTLPTTPKAPLYIRVRMVGGGGGGQGGGSSSATNGSSGATSTFGSGILSASGGVGGNGFDPAGGGSASLGSGPYGLIVPGGYGQVGGITNSTIVAYGVGGNGGGSMLGGNGGGAGSGFNGTAGTLNTGGGGGGGGSTNATDKHGGSGGGAGGGLDAIIASPSSTYVYSVGGGGAAGLGAGGGGNGGDGASGMIEVTEYYQ